MLFHSLARARKALVFVPVFAALFVGAGQAQVLTVTQNQSIAAGTTASYTSIAVSNGATLTVGGGSTLTVSGAVTVTGNSNIVIGSVNNAAQVNGAWAGAGSTIYAVTVQVDAGSSINADGQGYINSTIQNQNVPGAGPGGAGRFGDGGGASYGGFGGGIGGDGASHTLYGSVTAPVDLGSGGNCAAGGGAVRMNVSSALTLNGTISANGQAPVSGCADGAGGSVWVTTQTLAGSGAFLAEGGSTAGLGGHGGGGGRVSVSYASATGFSGFASSNANGGTGVIDPYNGYSCTPDKGCSNNGQPGTIVFIDTTAVSNTLNVSQSQAIPVQTRASYAAINVSNGATLTIGGGGALYVSGAVTVTGNSNIVMGSVNNTAPVNGVWAGASTPITAGSVQVDAGSSINADGQGYQPVNGTATGPGPGSYGGEVADGGDGFADHGPYGFRYSPLDLGSSGSTSAGGGNVSLLVLGTLTNNGVISANAPTIASGIGAAGGGVYVETQALAGSGSFNANGGSTTSSNGYGGGGGRIAVIFADATNYAYVGYSANSVLGGAVAGHRTAPSPHGPFGPDGEVGTLVLYNTSIGGERSGVLTFKPYQDTKGNTVRDFTFPPYTDFADYGAVSLLVEGGAILHIGGGSTINLAGFITVTGNSSINLQSVNNTAQVNGVWSGVGSPITAQTVQVDAGSSLNADGGGYAAEAGPGANPGPASTAGGSYGGEGGRGPTNADGSRAFTFEYGSARQPTDLGSGGWAYGGSAGAGGGLLQMSVTGNLILNGTISANGQGGSNSGAGSGGSVYVTAGGPLSGSGTFHADGGNSINSQGGAAGGGGGRIYVSYLGGSGFTGFATATANGGTSDDSNLSYRLYLDGTAGTVAFDDRTLDTGGNTGNSGALMVDEPYTIPAGTTATFDSITVANGAVLTVGGGSALTVTGNINVTGNSQIQLGSINTTAQVNGKWAGQSSTIVAGSVNVDAGSSINADGLGYVIEAGPGSTPGPYTHAGGSYGGVGGHGSLNPDGSKSTALEYGSPNLPIDLGSGGWAYYGTAGNGGGAVVMTVSGALTLNGTISANGQGGSNSGAGSGGSVYVTAASLSGGGAFSANGGNSINSQGGAAGGGGGRIAVYTNSTTGFTGFTGSTVNGGTSDDRTPSANAYLTGTPGTIAFFDTSTSTPSVATYQRFTLPASSPVTYTNITATNGATLVVGGGATVNASGTLLVTGDSTVQVQSINNTAQVNGQWVGQGSVFNAANVQVDKGSNLNADAQGYGIDDGPGAIAGPGSTAGGSYGGGGGRSAPDSTTSSSYEYGSEAQPTDIGSGGWNYAGIGGTGGGAIRLNVSGTMTLNGTVTANGQNSSGYAGSGAGGSIYVTAGTLTGAGTFAATGGSGSDSNGANSGGGGGRIAVYSPVLAGFTGGPGSSVAGGTSGSALPGTQGTLAFFDSSVPAQNVSVYGRYDLPVNSTTTFNNLTVAKGGNVVAAGGSQLTINQTLHLTGTITARSINNTGLVNGQYAGKGISILANTAQIDAGGVITADSQGYFIEQGPGAEAGPYTAAGGSYGGVGGARDNAGTYGSATLPLDLGSGGWQYAGNAGAGGGAIELLVASGLTMNGTLTANGGGSTGDAGGGAGGSIFVAANTINGSGTISAVGGSNASNAGGGGGGGRVSVLYAAANSLPQASISVVGGTNSINGAAGTINLQQQAFSQFILPVQPVIHDTAQLEWFTDAGGTTAVSLAGPRTQQVATGAGAISTASFDTTAFPDGGYQLRLSVLETTGKVVQVITKNEVINNSVTWHSGTLTANAEWTAGKVHALDGNVIVPNGVTLTIDPGAIVKALPGTSIIVQSGGTLNATGTANAPVIFTTFDDSSIGGNTDFNAGTSVPQPGEWQGIVLEGTGVLNSNANTQVLYTQALLSGTLPGNQSLLGTRVYTITGTLTVPNGVTLNIQPGALVKFAAGAGIDVQAGGTLNASGTLAQPIYLTSINDSSIGGVSPGSDGSLPTAGDWNSIEVDGGTATFNYAHLLYGGGPQNSGAQAGMIETGNNAKVTISNSELAYAFFIGLQTGYPNGGGDTVTVTSTIFRNNEDRAINTYSGSIVHIVNDTFDGNAAGVFNHGGTVDVENSVVTNSSSTQFGSIGLCCGGTYSGLSYNDAYTSVSGVANYVGLTDPTNTNGNLSVAPVYSNVAQHDYRPTYGSPLIDAANGTVTGYPATDAYGNQRFNSPLVTAKTGKADPNGKYPDIGAFEFVQSAPSNLDLTVSNVQGPTSAIVGSQVQLSWTVTNVGTGTVYGPWHDSVYVVADPKSNGIPVLAQTLIQGQGVVLGPGASYQATATVTVPGTTAGEQQWQVHTNVLGEIFEGANTGNNSANSLDTVAIDLQQILPGGSALSGTFAGDSQSAYFKIEPSASQTTQVQLALTGVTGNAVELFIGAGYVPTPQHYDYTQTQFDAASVSAVIPAGAAQTYYVTAYAQDLASAPAGFTVAANSLQFSLTGVNPASVTNDGQQTLTFTGGSFTSATTFSLTGPGGGMLAPVQVFVADAAHASVTFDFTKAATGSYTAQAANGTAMQTLTNAVQVTTYTGLPFVGEYPGSGVSVALDAPEAFRAGFPSTVTLTYTNVTSVDVPAPLIAFTATNATLSENPPPCTTCGANYTQQYASTFNGGLLLGISPQGPAGVLPAGASNSIQFTVTPAATGTVSFVAAPVNVDIIATQLNQSNSVFPSLQQLLNGYVQQSGYYPAQTGAYGSAADFCTAITATGESAAGMTRACMQLLNDAGYSYTAPQPDKNFPGYDVNGPNVYVNGRLTAKQLSSALARVATALSAQGTYEYDAKKLLLYLLNHDGYGQFRQIYHQGAFGYNFDLPFNISLLQVNNGLTELLPTGATRVFTLASTQPSTYLGSTGDYGTIVQQADGSFLLTEQDGHQYHFPASTLASAATLLDYVQAANGYKVQVIQGASVGGVPLITAVSDSLGNRISYTYDKNNVVTQATDAQGRTASYTYNEVVLAPSGLRNIYLTGVTDSTGSTVLTWQQAGKDGAGYIDDSCVLSFCEQPVALTRVQNPDGTEIDLSYDAAGRATAASGAGGAQTTKQTYNADGSVSSTDGLGNATTYLYDYAGHLTSVVNPMGAATRLQLDAEGKPVRVLGGLGDSTQLAYDGSGNLSSLTLANGSYATLSFGSNALPVTLTDPLGSAYTAGYDANGNRTSLADPTGAKLSYTYNALGQVLTRTNRRGQTTTFTYNAAGQVSTETLSTGAVTTFTYDGHGNPVVAAGPAGTTTYSYDAADRLLRVANSDGTGLTYTYNAGGQRTSLKDSAGYNVQYSYDALGRLQTLADAGGHTLVTYTYDAAGHITNKTFGNGTSTAITVDASGRKTDISNFSPARALTSEYTYTYDADGNPVTAKTPAGAYTYGYDLSSQLTSVATASGTLSYSYDANGNRIAVAGTGGTVTYATNNLNQYTAVGTASYRYDADGDLLSDGAYTYTYDELGELSTATSATDSWSYTYNSNGARTAATHNGTTTRYLVDPTGNGGNGTVVATFSGSGTLLSHYVFGNDLTEAVAADGTASFYNLDLAGSTTQMTNSSGAVVNSYSYLPFGERTTLAAAVANPFTYAGSYGALDDGFGPYLMRNRWYQPSIGRFLQPDPVGFAGGDTNLYRYVNNSPVESVDPQGFLSLSDAYDTASHVSNYAGVFTSGVASSANNIFGLYGTIKSLGDNVDNGDALGSIHDFTVGSLAVAQTYLNHNPAATEALLETGVGGLVYLTIQGAGIIDQGSQDIFNNFFQSAYAPPNPFCPSCGDTTPPQPGVPPVKLPIKVPQPTINVPVRGAIDPNGKMTSGYGDAGYVPAGAAITYTIFFENQSTATAPAQKVTVTDALPKNLDFSTVQLTQIAFNNAALNIPEGVQTYKGQALVSTDTNPVAVNASLNPTTGLLTWTMQSVDPVTNGTPANPLAGFLPPNNSANAGVGSVTFTVKPLANQANGATVSNQANIVFDANAAIATNTVTNTLDITTPTSAVGPLPSTSGTSFIVSWSGSDPSGSGIASYNIYVAVDGGQYMLWQTGTTSTSATYTGVVGHSYSFISLATNNVGTVQTTPSAAVATSVSGQAATVAVTPASGMITQSQSLSVGISVTGASVPKGTVQLTSGTYASAATSLNGGAATIVVPAGSLAIGTNTLTATYTPDGASAGSFSSGTGTAMVTVTASMVSVTVGTSPAGASFSVDGTAYTTQQTLSWTAGSTHTIVTSSPQTAGGVQQTFTAWSDGGAISHVVTAASSTTSYLATFATSYLLTTSANPAAAGTVTPVSGTYYATGTAVPLTATPASGYTFANWTGNVAATNQASTTVTMSAPQTVVANFTAVSAPGPTFTINPSALTFTAAAGSTTAAQSVTLTNTSSATLQLNSIAISGANATLFSQANTCGTSLAAQGTCKIAVTFSPTAAGTFAASLTLTDNASNSPQIIALTGTGTAPPSFTLAISPTSQSISAGATATFNITVAAQNGAFNNPVTLSVSGLPGSAMATFQPAIVTPGSGSAGSVLSIPTSSLRAEMASPHRRGELPVLACFGALLWSMRRRRKAFTRALLLFLAGIAAGSIVGCGTSPTVYTLTVTAMSAASGSTPAMQQTSTITLSVR